jgi:cysteine-S-conjugate beta-lyase
MLRSLNWSRAGPNLAPLDVSEMDAAVVWWTRKALVPAIARYYVEYFDPDAALCSPLPLAIVFAGRMRSKPNLPANPERVVARAQVVQALCCVILALSELGDRILMREPTYPRASHAIDCLHRWPVTVSGAGGCREETFASPALTPAEWVAVIVISNPHDLTWRLFGVGRLATLTALPDRHGSVIFADEVNQDMTYERSHGSVTALKNAAECTSAATSVANSFNVSVVRCAMGYFGSSAVLRKFRDWEWHLRGRVGALEAELTLVTWSACEPSLEAFWRKLYHKRVILVHYLRPVHGYTTQRAAHFAWLDLYGIAVHSDHTYLRNEQKTIHARWYGIWTGLLRLRSVAHRCIREPAERRSLRSCPDIAKDRLSLSLTNNSYWLGVPKR